MVAFAIFRSPNVGTAFEVIKGLFGFNGVVLPESYESSMAFLKGWGMVFKTLPYSNVRLNDLLFLIALMAAALALPNSMYWKERFLRHPIISGLTAATVFVACVINLDAVTEFLYYQF